MNYELRKLTKKNISVFVIIFSYFILRTLYFANAVNAQAISLSVSPPLFELTIKPGKEINQIYTLTNNGGDVTLIPDLVYFSPTDTNGNIELTKDKAPEWIKYSKDPIKLKGGDKIDFNVLISPPENTEEVDHFLTLFFESDAPADILEQNATLYQTQIGTNILVTISKDGNPKKSAEIIDFSAPKIIDSVFGKINYKILIKNNGNSFWKPIGKIKTTDETLKLAPQNILSGTSRTIKCVNYEDLKECGLQNKFRIGKITSSIEFRLDDEALVYKKDITTFAFPYSLLGLIIMLLTLFKSKGILILWKKRK